MTPTEQGNYCQRCAKNVIDFSTKSDAEVIRIIQNSNGKVCGRFKPTQLERVITLPPEQSTAAPLYKALAGALLLSSTQAAMASQSSLPGTTTAVSADADKLPVPEDNLPVTIKGTVTDGQSCEPLYACTIKFKNTDLQTHTDASGNFKFTIPDDKMQDTLVFELTLSGYDTTEIKVMRSAIFENRVIELNPEQTTLNRNVVMLDPVVISEPASFKDMITVMGALQIQTCKPQYSSGFPLDMILLHYFH